MRIAHAGLAALAAVLLLAGCGAATPTPTQTSGGQPSASPAPAATPEIHLEGSATSNKAYFDLVNERLIAAGGTLDGRAFIDNLVAAGYAINVMEVTSDRTAINGPADNISFSIKINGNCLIGQYGNIGYDSTTGAILETGRCLIGTTRTIDW
ncbi:MAG: hypothetical protein ABIR17_09700 [Pseudolysinimonas sp.]|uniref:DUF6993 domain-containing protein n=1 Tax=Pseudolysinimonas sp. TaxID=2680009 RepID=UPI003266BECD